MTICAQASSFQIIAAVVAISAIINLVASIIIFKPSRNGNDSDA